jgi:chromosome segregation ATPase
MSLVFSKGKKDDTRKVENDKAIVRGNLEKAALEKELEQKRREVEKLQAYFAKLQNDGVADFKKSIQKLEEEKERKEELISHLDSEIKKKKQDVVVVEFNKKKAESALSEALTKSASVNSSIRLFEKTKNDLVKEVEMLLSKKENQGKEIKAVKTTLDLLLKDVAKARAELKSVEYTKINLTEAVEQATKELERVSEIISLLDSKYEQGLQEHSLFAGELAAIEKEKETLKQKERDLVMYEKRLEDERKKVGIKSPMVFLKK